MRRLILLLTMCCLTVACEAPEEEVAETDPAAKTPGIAPESYCERGWQQSKEVYDRLAKKPKETKFPDREPWLEQCAKLPVDVQRCTMVDYATKNADECDDAVEAVDEETRAALAQLIAIK